jgi:hypothetical protein
MDKIAVSGLISPIFPNDTYPVIDPRFGIDGLRSLDTLSDMYNLPLEKRRAGMVVGIPITISNTTAYYKLKPEGNGVTWSLGGVSNWDNFFSTATGSLATPVKYTISNETINVPNNHEYLIWGNLTIGASGSFVNDGKTYVINGTIATASDGATSGSGQYIFVSVPTKYGLTFTSTPIGVTISHNLDTRDITYSVRQGSNFVTVNVEIVDSNSVFVYSNETFSQARITIIG